MQTKQINSFELFKASLKSLIGRKTLICASNDKNSAYTMLVDSNGVFLNSNGSNKVSHETTQAVIKSFEMVDVYAGYHLQTKPAFLGKVYCESLQREFLVSLEMNFSLEIVD